MTPADWLLIVLGAYLHDLGLLATEAEFARRSESDFNSFVSTTLFVDDAGRDYRARVDELEPDKRERFLYQEFVRHHHARRIREWILGQSPQQLGVATEAANLLHEMLLPLDTQFRRDLALICESHHLDDLANFQKYKFSQPYGNSDAETANVFYAALILRTADLLHITRDRTPSTMFRLVNPSDPVSLEEWSKQMAVRSVRQKLGRDRDGNPSHSAPQDTVEVHAYFTSPDGFFGLTSYLAYAGTQLSQSYEWAQTAAKKGSRFEFPWRYIDDENVEAEGFLPQPFEFTLDQVKILDLLTGHTLYNDAGVVLRELVQNAIDAVRLQRLIDSKDGMEGRYQVTVRWNSSSRLLEVVDSGTGMSQSIIEKHFLRVGSSRYQDPQFKREFGSFAPISRFGIGVLSAFMISDKVDIFTVHVDDERARHLSLRSVHGRYLVRLLDKHGDPTTRPLAPHGTLIRLNVRPSADIGDVLATVRKWVVIPGCEVTFIGDGAEPVAVGYASPRDALAHVISASDDSVKVHQVDVGEVTVAYGLRWSSYFKEWGFLRGSGDPSMREGIGTCIEGIRVESATPGFTGRVIVALSNATGANAPKTNVARSGLEATRERDELLAAVYKAYAQHVADEIEGLVDTRGFSLTWAVQEAAYISAPLIARDRSSQIAAINENLLRDAFESIPSVLIEQDGARKVTSIAALREMPHVWTVEGELFRSAEDLLREVGRSGSLAGIAELVGLGHVPTPLLCGGASFVTSFAKMALEDREVDTLAIDEKSRRLDLRWSTISSQLRWRTLILDDAEHLRMARLMDDPEMAHVAKIIRVGIGDIRLVQTGDYRGVQTNDALYVLPGSAAAELLRRVLDVVRDSPSDDTKIAATKLFWLFGQSSNRRRRLVSDIPTRISRYIDDEELERLGVEADDVADHVDEFRSRVYDPSRWSRQDHPYGYADIE